MSRSIGDWEAGEVGVIPDPMIDILDMNEIKRKVLKNLNEACKGETQEVEIDPANGEPSPVDPCVTYAEKDVKIFLNENLLFCKTYNLSFKNVKKVCL